MVEVLLSAPERMKGAGSVDMFPLFVVLFGLEHASCMSTVASCMVRCCTIWDSGLAKCRRKPNTSRRGLHAVSHNNHRNRDTTVRAVHTFRALRPLNLMLRGEA